MVNTVKTRISTKGFILRKMNFRMGEGGLFWGDLLNKMW